MHKIRNNLKMYTTTEKYDQILPILTSLCSYTWVKSQKHYFDLVCDRHLAANQSQVFTQTRYKQG